MSNFPFPWWDKTITIYNKLIDPTTQRVSWYKYTVENCFWKAVNEVYTVGGSHDSHSGISLETKNIICRIPQNESYVDKRIWEGLKEEERKDYFTLGNEDIIVLGEVADTIDEYAEGKRSTDLLTKYKKYDECLEIDTYVINTYTGVGLPHYRVVGR